MARKLIMLKQNLLGRCFDGMSEEWRMENGEWRIESEK
jgi:hypothetical protein